jgi:hypothetical protein
MITDILLNVLTYFIDLICSILPGWQIWPESLLTGLQYFFSKLLIFNFIFPIDTLLLAIIFFVGFESLYFSVKIIMKVFNFFRGTGSGLDL